MAAHIDPHRAAVLGIKLGFEARRTAVLGMRKPFGALARIDEQPAVKIGLGGTADPAGCRSAGCGHRVIDIEPFAGGCDLANTDTGIIESRAVALLAFPQGVCRAFFLTSMTFQLLAGELQGKLQLRQFLAPRAITAPSVNTTTARRTASTGPI